MSLHSVSKKTSAITVTVIIRFHTVKQDLQVANLFKKAGQQVYADTFQQTAVVSKIHFMLPSFHLGFLSGLFLESFKPLCMCVYCFHDNV